MLDAFRYQLSDVHNALLVLVGRFCRMRLLGDFWATSGRLLGDFWATEVVATGGRRSCEALLVNQLTFTSTRIRPAEIFSDIGLDAILVNVPSQPKEAPQERRSPVLLENLSGLEVQTRHSQVKIADRLGDYERTDRWPFYSNNLEN